MIIRLDAITNNGQLLVMMVKCCSRHVAMLLLHFFGNGVSSCAVRVCLSTPRLHPV